MSLLFADLINLISEKIPKIKIVKEKSMNEKIFFIKKIKIS